MVKTPHFQCEGVGSIPGGGTSIPHVSGHGQKINKLKKKKKERVGGLKEKSQRAQLELHSWATAMNFE